MSGVLGAAALLLLVAGLTKLRQPSATRSVFTAARLPGAQLLSPLSANRLAGAAETGLGLVALLAGGRVSAAVVAGVFAVLTVLAARMVAVESGQDCGCFGRSSPITSWHTAVNAGCAVAGLVGLALPAASLPARLGAAPATGAALVLAAVVLAYLAYLLMTALPELLAASAALEVSA